MTPLARERWLAGLLALGAVAGTVTVLGTAKDITTGEERARVGNLFAAFYESEISRITLTRTDEPAQSFVLERAQASASVGLSAAPSPTTGSPTTGSPLGPASPEELTAETSPASASWRLVTPRNELLDVAAMKQYLSVLRHLTWVRAASSAASRETLGLDRPKETLFVEMAGASYELRFGGAAPQPVGARYVEVLGRGVPNAGVYVVTGSSALEALPKPDSLRVRRLVPYGASELSEVVMTGDGGERHMARRGDGAWYFVGSRPLRLERDAIERVFIQLSRTEADQFVASGDVAAWLAKPGPRVEVLLRPEDSQLPVAKFEIGGACPPGTDGSARVVASRREPEPVAACVPGNVLIGLTTSADAMIARHVTRLHLDEIEELRIEVPEQGAPNGTQRIELVRRENAYRLRAPSEGDVTKAAGDERLRVIAELQGEPEAAVPADAELVATVTLTPAGDHAADVFRVSRAGDTLWARREADGAALRLPASAAGAFRVDGSLLRSLDLLKFDKHRLRALHVTGSVEQRLEFGSGGDVHLKLPSGFEVDATLALDVAGTLADLNAERWVADARAPGDGLDRPTLTVEFALDSEVRKKPGDDASQASSLTRHTLTLGARAPGGYFASLDQDPAVFVLGSRAERVLSTWVLSRGVFDLHWDEATSIVIAARGETLTLRRVGSEFAPSRLPSLALAELEAALRQLVPDYALHPGGPRVEEGFATPVLDVAASGGAPVRYRVGREDVHRDTLGFYARADGVNATYFVPSARVRAVLDAL